MCGICGILDYSHTETGIDQQLLKRMTDVIAHRGPDDDGSYISDDKKVGLGFRRLSIIDLSPAGHQPMSNEDGSIWIVFNGEIYNHTAIRAELEAKGYRYHSKTDTETIIYGYQEWGTKIFTRMYGMWDLAIWDGRKKQLVCARDRIGIKPLYYTFQNGRFLFGSEIKSILQHPAMTPELDEEGLNYYLTFLMSAAPGTMFKGINKLEPGHFLIVRADGGFTKEKYWDLLDYCSDANKLPANVSEKEVEEEIIRLLRQSIKDRMMSDVPFGVFLSGGIDSSVNVALMAELMDRPVQTFTVGFKELEKYNELEYAHKIVDRFKTNHHEILIDHNDAVDIFDKLVWHEDEPNGDPVCIPLYYLSKIARESGTIVLQVGEGSDEEFAGYNFMLRDLKFYERIWKRYITLPRFIKKGAQSLASLYFTPQHRYLELEYFRRAVEGEELAWGGAVDLTETHKKFLMVDGKSRSSTRNLPYKYDQELLARNPNADFLQRMAFLEFRNRLPELLLMRVDKITMAHSIEARVPFLDHRLVQYAMSIPQSLKTKNWTPKYILKKAVEGIIPNEIIYRPKQGFNAPTTEWFRGPLEKYAYNRIFNSRLAKENLFNYDFIKQLFADNKRGRKNGQSIWTILNFTMWWEHWLNNK
jgi:asparagine synthase (glutamine-hydrolysing)